MKEKFHPLPDSKAARMTVNVGWTCFCLYVFKKLTKHHTLWWQALEENPNKPKDFAGRSGRKDRPHSRQPLHIENRKGESHPLLHIGGHLQGTGVPARRHFRIQG